MIEFLRKKAGVIIMVIIGFAIISFLFSDAIRYGNPLGPTGNMIARVNGEELLKTDFDFEINQAKNTVLNQYPNASEEELNAYVVNTVYDQTILRMMMNQNALNMGLAVSPEELLFNFKNYPDATLRSIFADPNTGVYNPELLLNFLRNINAPSTTIEQREFWRSFEKKFKSNLLMNKYASMINFGLYPNAIETQNAFKNRNSIINFDYVFIPYDKVDDSAVVVKDEDYEAFYQEHKAFFDSQYELRDIKYVIFDIIPSPQDSLSLKKNVMALFDNYKEVDEKDYFVNINTDNKFFRNGYYKRGDLNDDALDQQIFNNKKAKLIPPQISNGIYKFVEVNDYIIGPDSVEAKHILLDTLKYGGLKRSEQLADSLKNLVDLNLESFENLAFQFSNDNSSKANGGSLGTFGRGVMVPTFENAAFNMSVDKVKTITSTFGIHLIKLVRTVGQSQYAYLRMLEKYFFPGKQTLKKRYKEARTFLKTVQSMGIDDASRQGGYPVFKTEGVLPHDFNLNELGNMRSIISWAFKQEQEKVVANEIFSNQKQLIIASLDKILPKGPLSWKEVQSAIEEQVIRRVESKVLLKELKKHQNKTLKEIAKAYDTQVNQVNNIVFSNPIIRSANVPEYKTIGYVFGSASATEIRMVEGAEGIYAFKVNQLKPSNNEYTQSTMQEFLEKQRIQNSPPLIRVVLDKSNKIEDFRSNFY